MLSVLEDCDGRANKLCLHLKAHRRRLFPPFSLRTRDPDAQEASSFQKAMGSVAYIVTTL